MATIEIKKNNTPATSMVDLANYLRSNVNVGEAQIDGLGHGIAIYGDMSMDEGKAVIQHIVDNLPSSNGHVEQSSMQEVLYLAMKMEDANIDTKEKMEKMMLNGKDYFISFDKKKIYSSSYNEIADFSEFGEMPKAAAIKLCKMLIHNH